MGEGVTNSSKNVFFVSFVVVLVGVVIYGFFAVNFAHFGLSTERFLFLLNTAPELPAHSVLFMGDSQIREDVDCIEIEKESGRTCFNMGIAGILPLQVALARESLLASKPDVVVLGVSPLLFQEDVNKNDDFFYAMNRQGDWSRDTFLLERLSEKERELLTMNRFKRMLYVRKFMLPFYVDTVKSLVVDGENTTGRYPVQELKTPFVFETKQTREELQQKISDQKTVSLFDIRRAPVREREALMYLIRDLNERNISVVLVDMPLHPLLRERMNADAVLAYERFVDALAEQYGIPLFSFQEEFSAEEFIDLTHLTREGREHFSKLMAVELQRFQEGNSGVI